MGKKNPELCTTHNKEYKEHEKKKKMWDVPPERLVESECVASQMSSSDCWSHPQVHHA